MSHKLWKEAKKYIASGTQTYSKEARRYVEGVYPYFIDRGFGAYVYDNKDNRYIDYPCALGAVILGYANSRVNEAVRRRLDQGTLFSLPNELELALAKRLHALIPSMESMRFLKSGSEAVSAGIKIARAYTKRTVVLSNGYHGWHDWSTPLTPRNAGTPSQLNGTILEFKLGDLKQLEWLLKTNEVACVVLDPYIFTYPGDGYYKNLIRLAHKYKSLVLFDEVVTGIRWERFSVQNAYGVKPDLTALGKTLANGLPISCIGGSKKIMKVVDEDCFVSSTYGGDLVGIVGAIATLDIAIEEKLPLRLQESGEDLRDYFNVIMKVYDLPIRCEGSPYRMTLTGFPTDEHKALLWQECVKRGVLFGGAQHTNLCHTQEVLDQTYSVVEQSAQVLRRHWDNPLSALEGKVPVKVDVISKARS